MSGKGHCYDNAIIETFCKTLKSALIRRISLLTSADIKAAVARYTGGFQNPIRCHCALDDISPVQFDRNAAK